ncbi:MAG: DNA polymerase domain-containing protein, partial [Firmicutes bacterium]|nr:DNA polymerase domain-containing protein [Bacillota bacterium]
MADTTVIVEGNEVKLTNLEKLLWPEGITKADLILYYSRIAGYILPFLRHRFFVMNRYPDGIYGESFYQKNCPDYAPDWIQIYPLSSPGGEKTVKYIICDNEATLI